MMGAKNASTEANADARLAALIDLEVLDTPPEQAFEDIVQLASTICDTPVALVSLVDRDRQWFKASLGFPDCQTDLERSVCKHVVAAKTLLVIPDLTADPRTSANPLVTGEPHIRFYAGAPLTTREGHVLGALCVIDQKVRPDGLSASQASALSALARQTVDAMELRRAFLEREAVILARVEAEAAIEASELRWTQIFQTLQEGFVLGIALRDDSGRMIDWRYEQVNAAWSQLTGVPAEDAIGRTIREVFPGIEDEWISEFRPAIDANERIRFTRQMGALGRWYDGLVEPVGPERFTVLFSEVTERIAATVRQNALLELGDVLRDCATVPELTRAAARITGLALKASRASYGLVDPSLDAVEIEPDWTADGVSSISGRHRFDDFGQIRNELRGGAPLIIDDVRTDPRTASDPAPMLALGIGSLVNMPVRERGQTVGIFIVHAAEKRSWTEPELAFIRNVADRLEISIARLRAEMQQDVLNSEISHRLKNSLAMVQGIAAQTFRNVVDKDALAAFNLRLSALGKAHDALTQSSWTAAELSEVVSSALGQLISASRWSVEGPPVKLGPRATLSTSMLLHELATNAIKYGSLSVESGTVQVTWRIEGAEEQAELVLAWRERGGPPATEPMRRGFGTRLLKLGLIGTGGSNLSYEALGFSATFRANQRQVEQA